MRPRVSSDDMARDLGELYGRSLTRRQTEVLLLVMAGHTYLNDIARKLTISRSATAGHISTIYAKTGANNLTDLVLMLYGAIECPGNLHPIRERLGLATRTQKSE